MERTYKVSGALDSSLQVDQIAVPVVFESKLPSLQTESTFLNEAKWILFGEGPLTSPVFEAVGYVKVLLLVQC